ncbi:Mpp10 protein [Serendipita vermifera]|nr:Mpp10 protein [Serendipita vermifera]
MSTTEVAEPPEAQKRLTKALKGKHHLFATGDTEIQDAALAAAQQIFDSALSQETNGFHSIKNFVSSLVNDMNQHPRETRSQKQSREQQGNTVHPKMAPMLEAANKLQGTPLASLYVQGMGSEQVWNQLELRAKNICHLVDLVFEGEYPDPEALEKESSKDEDEEMEVDEEGSEMEEDDEEASQQDDETEESSEGEMLGEHVVPLNSGTDKPSRRGFPWNMDLDRTSDQKAAKASHGKQKGPRHPILDDEFFSISDFNREIESAEAKSSSRGKLKGDDDTEDDEESVDLFAEMDEEEMMDDDEEEGDAIMYGDFFDPPSGDAANSPHRTKAKKDQEESILPRRESKVRFHEEVKVKLIKNRARHSMFDDDMSDDEDDEEEDGLFHSLTELKRQFGAIGDDDDDEEEDEDEEEGEKDEDEEDENSGEDEEDDEDEEEGFEAIERMKDDLFADEKPDQSDLSTFAQRQLALKKQIEELEQENIAQKDWTLMGEATSRSRPVNSLLEEDLDFEHRQRVVPVITEEKVKSLEELIKARILEGRYDDVVRRRALDDKPFLPSKIFELQDTKSAQSLAQIYEDEYTAARTGGTIDDRDGKLQKEHEELESIWEGISSKLDALSNAHFTPKTSKGVISTISNVASTSLESALPTAKSVSSLLAPEEVFSTTKPGVVASKGEMTSREKQSNRLKKRKERMKMRQKLDSSVDKYSKMKKGSNGKSNGVHVNGVEGGKHGKGKKGREKMEKAAAIKSLVKTGKGVTVVGKANKK